MDVTKKTGILNSAIYCLLLLSVTSFSYAQMQTGIYDAVIIEENEKTSNISTNELQQILESNSAKVFDVRTFKEYSISHIPGALNVIGKPGTTREEFTSDANQIDKTVGGDKEQHIVLYCNGPYCGKSKRVVEDLLTIGYKNVSRYQLGIPVWRALGGITEIELEGIQYLVDKDQTLVFIDTRDADLYHSGTLKNALNIPATLIEPGKGGPEIIASKKDGRLPMEDHNTRIIVFGQDGEQAKVVAMALVKNAFHNVSYFPGTIDQILNALEY